MRHKSLILQLDPDALHSPATIAHFAERIEYIDTKDPSKKREFLLRIRVQMGRVTRKFPQTGDQAIPDGKIEIKGQAPIDGWWGWRWIKVVLENEIHLFTTLFVTLDEQQMYTAASIGEYATINDFLVSKDENPISLDEKFVVLVVVRLLVLAPSSPLLFSRNDTSNLNFPQYVASGKMWQQMAHEALERAVIEVFGKRSPGLRKNQ